MKRAVLTADDDNVKQPDNRSSDRPPRAEFEAQHSRPGWSYRKGRPRLGRRVYVSLLPDSGEVVE